MKKKKEELNIDIKKSDKNIIKLKDLVSIVKFIATFGIIASSFISLVVIILCTITTLSISTGTTEQLLNNNSVIEYVAKINSYSISEVKDTIGTITNKGLFVTFDVILPSIIILAIFIFLIIASKKIINFVKDVKSNKSLFTTQKLKELKEIEMLLSVIGIILFIAFGFSYIIVYIILVITLEIILYLFNYCVNAEIEKAKE